MLPTPRVLLLLRWLWLLSEVVMGMQNTRLYSPEELTQKPLSLQRRGRQVGCERLPTSGYACDPGWSVQEVGGLPLCLWPSPQPLPWTQASDTCRSQAASLPSPRQGRQRVFRDLMVLNGFKAMWGRSEHQILSTCDLHTVSAQSWAGSAGSRKVRCTTPNHFMCVRTPDCMVGRWGPGCAYQCHCVDGGEQCRHKCSSGCRAGWTGDHCCSRQGPPELAYYCRRGQGGQQLVIHLHTGLSYQVLRLLDGRGQPRQWCSNVSLAMHNVTYLLTIPVPPPSPRPTPPPNPSSSCGRETTGNNSYRWRLSLQEREGLRLPYDRTFVLACDFNNAHTTTEDSADTGYSVPDQQLQVVEPVTEEVDLQVVDPDTEEALQEVELGQTVILRMRLNVSKENLRAEGVSPYSCSAASPDGKVTRNLTDHRGCAVPDSPLSSSFQGGNGTVRTGAFPLFSLAGQPSLTIRCRLRFCFSPPHALCDDRCAVLSDQAGRGRRQAGRGRRQAGGQGVMVVAQVHVLPDAGSRQSRQVHSSDGGHLHADMMTPVTWFLVIILLVLSGALVYMLYFCPNNRATSRVGKLRM